MIIEVKKLTRVFGRTCAVDQASFRFGAGQIFGFVGPNGAGKTTTMRIMATLDEPTSGDVLINGISVMQYPEQTRALVGYVPDSLPAHADMTVHEYLDFFARAHGLQGKTRREAVEEVALFTGLTPLREKTLNALSKGMKQRVSLGRALVHDPAVLIMDEPAAGLDPRARIELRELLRVLAERGKAVLISSHILSELSEMCQGVIIIEQGRILEEGTIRDVVNRGVRLRTLIVRVLERHDDLHRTLLQWPGVASVRRVSQELHADLDGQDEHCCDLLHQLVRQEYRVAEFKLHKADLESVFMNVTRGTVQ
jgi:ABC-2 type transport system ATP-binding protein